MRQNDAHSNGHKNAVKTPMKNGASKMKPSPKLKRNKCDLGPDFVAPDGGWAWFVLVAAGCSNVSKNDLQKEFYGLEFVEMTLNFNDRLEYFYKHKLKLKSYKIINQ